MRTNAAYAADEQDDGRAEREQGALRCAAGHGVDGAPLQVLTQHGGDDEEGYGRHGDAPPNTAANRTARADAGIGSVSKSLGFRYTSHLAALT